ncbi:glycine betaine transporter 1 isoform X1 [Hydra vulgaris]|uniref:glycine betaine transporter 1 isoform X1 n=1 Tax=Hydra vulgaris TaxID=6087 RepID=UPI000640C6CF|nr:glycine betaine transporter 1 [Hydra vulgaris]
MNDEKTYSDENVVDQKSIEVIRQKYMNKCRSVESKIGPFNFYFNPITSIVSAVIIWTFVGYCIFKPIDAKLELLKVKYWVTNKWTWLYIGTKDVWGLFIIFLYFSKYSELRLGCNDEKPEYSDSAYFMMLFSAGLGIGLFYYGVAEPIYHYKPGHFGNRFFQRYSNNDEAQDAINLTFFHWGIHSWIVYVIIGLLLGILSYRRGLPLTMRTCLYPIIGDKIFGIMGDLIDTLCIICTMFGVCTSLGLGATQLNNGIHRINPKINESISVQIIIIWCVTACATLSVVSGVKFGIRRLSELCFGMGSFIMAIIFFADNTSYLLNLFVQSIGYYLQWLIQVGFHTEAFAQLGNAPDKKEAPKWIDTWTIFYWGWWVSWSPFVGMFIAKISRGRKIKDFIFYTLTVPTIYSLIWMTVFGGVGIQFENKAENKGMNCSMYYLPINNTFKYKTRQMELFGIYGTTMLSCRGTSDMWFDVMNMYGDIGMALSILSLFAIVLYFVTSSDSGSLVIDCLSANGSLNPPIVQRIFWSLTEGATATALLVAGGKDSLEALQTVSVACGLPITIFLNWACVSLWRALREEAGEIELLQGRWQLSMWSLNNKQRVLKSIISLFFPWYYLSRTKMKIENKKLLRYTLLYGILYATPFYISALLLLAGSKFIGMKYIAYAVLLFFCIFCGFLRGDVRERYNIEGDMIEDTFSFVLVYPIAIMQIHEQVQNDLDEVKGLEMPTANGSDD